MSSDQYLPAYQTTAGPAGQSPQHSAVQLQTMSPTHQQQHHQLPQAVNLQPIEGHPQPHSGAPPPPPPQYGYSQEPQQHYQPHPQQPYYGQGPQSHPQTVMMHGGPHHGADGNVVVNGQQGVRVPAGPPDPELLDFAFVPGLMVKQRRTACCYEFFCCDAKSEFRIASLGDPGSGGWDARDRSWGPDIMYAAEESGSCARVCCGSSRSLEMRVNRGQTKDGGPMVTHYKKPYSCCVNCCCCFPEMQTFDALKNFVGKARIPCFCCIPEIDITDSQNRPTWKIRGVCCNCGMPQYNIMRPGDRTPKGHIRKEWAGVMQECCTNFDNFSVYFPPEADGKERANILGATFLLDYVFFESREGIFGGSGGGSGGGGGDCNLDC